MLIRKSLKKIKAQYREQQIDNNTKIFKIMWHHLCHK
jgi:hypothetical protein